MTAGLIGTIADLPRAAGRADAAIDPDREAVVLASTLTGVSQGVVGGHLSADDGRAVITYGWTAACRAGRLTEPGHWQAQTRLTLTDRSVSIGDRIVSWGVSDR